ncbi:MULTISPECIES: HNH endonuclease [Arthrobacter]|uniref:HNH endonuclease n=1 Tax=Arthrobacter TaxID=1663 RepID=UPI001D141790|nr:MULTISPECIES: HNH endonuclease signature motif containing protein [Arthrobacter]MCC3281139.1 HNH endonuclease [Arthrobacter caoxuetaonis]MCC9192686.1 HNH endonuclease [Arthrobacter sp. zg-Y916]
MNHFSDTPFPRSADRDGGGAPGAEPGGLSGSSAFARSGSGAVFRADPALLEDAAAEALPEGFAGRLSLSGAETLGYEETVTALQRLGMLISWAQAQQARVAARLEVLFARDISEAAGREEPALALSLAAAEASTVLNIPHMTAIQLISESSRLCTDAPQTLEHLAAGKIALQHARIILDETHNLPTDIPDPPDVAGAGAVDPAVADDSSGSDPGQLELGLENLGAPSQSEPDGSGQAGASGPDGAGSQDAATAEVLSVRGAFERDLLAAAEGRTAAGFGRRARKLRESRFPDLIPVRHREARDKRRVTFQPLPDGMSCLSAIIAAEKGQSMFAALTGAAKAGKRAGDPRTMDQLRADTLTELLLDGEPAPDTKPVDGPTAGNGSDHGPRTNQEQKPPRRAERHRNRSTVRTEVMVLINADTLAGLNEHPAELNGYGPISAETARTMILDALHWTPLIQDPNTREILTVGRTRRIPAGLKRWLQARDGNCRFPGCSVNVTNTEIDHTTPFSRGGPTDHTNLEHLCPKHHRFKTLGHWEARQPEPGTLRWSSPTGRTYSTEAALDYVSGQQSAPGQRPRDIPLHGTQLPKDQKQDSDPDNDPPPF